MIAIHDRLTLRPIPTNHLPPLGRRSKPWPRNFSVTPKSVWNASRMAAGNSLVRIRASRSFAVDELLRRSEQQLMGRMEMDLSLLNTEELIRTEVTAGLEDLSSEEILAWALDKFSSAHRAGLFFSGRRIRADRLDAPNARIGFPDLYP